MPAGRPTLATPELFALICERLGNGESLTEICENEDMPSRNTVLSWKRVFPEFQGMYALAREDQADASADKITAVAKASTPETAAADRVKIDAYKWHAGKLKPREYGDKVDVTSGGEKITSETNASARAARLAAILADAGRRAEAVADGGE